MTHILYVEDDPASREVLHMAQRINPDMLALTVFDDSRDFEQRLTQLQPQPDLILLDIHVRPITGFEMLNIIRTREQYAATPVVALTASVMNEEIELLREAGFHGVISKPLNLDEFPELVQRTMAGEHIWNVW